MEKRIVIGGCRDYNDYKAFRSFVDRCIEKIGEGCSITVISGHCSGVDMMGERYAKERNLGLEIFPADWKRYGRAAGPVRNKQMVEACDSVIAFWDYKSKGTKSLISYAEKLGKEIFVKHIG